VRSADKAVSPLSWFTSLDCPQVTHHLERSFAADFQARASSLSNEELAAAYEMVASKYGTEGWVNRLP
jgi:lipoate-protein ligase A